MIVDAKTTPKGRLTIPAVVRKAIGLAPGGLLQFVVDDDGTVWIETVPPRPSETTAEDQRRSHSQDMNN